MSGARTSFYRPTGQSRRAVRNQQQFDHDVFEGLPIRRWNRQWMWYAKKNVPPPPPPELPLPKETHLLTPMSQTLLKAARNGTLGKPQDGEAAEANSTDKKAAGSTRLFMTNKWTVIPREDEPAEPEYLGRPPDTFSRHSRLVRKRVNGKVMIVEEELDEMYPEVPMPGVAVDGVAASPAQPIKRRPPPPKRKPGRGRKPGFKKMVTFSEDGRALPTGEGHATPSGTTGNGGEGEGDGEGEGEDDVEMGDVEDGTPDDQDNDGEDGDGENDVEATPLEKTATPEVTAAAAAAQVKKEGTVEPMDIASPVPTATASIPSIAEVVEQKIKSPTPVVAPETIKEPTPEEAAPEPAVEAPSEVAAEPTPAVEAPAPAAKSPTPLPSAIEEIEAASPSVNPLKRKSPSDEGEDALIDKELEKHEVSIAAAVAERESHDETLSPAPPPLAPTSD
ncbi:hypothetical protein TWF506_002836 [Arthrobotrys conoides]|uniref:LYR family protein n=1 Tax=Arthrobotrys conoides TaxID=74498 RepID=A0AAN8NHB8_9PEZI